MAVEVISGKKMFQHPAATRGKIGIADPGILLPDRHCVSIVNRRR